MKNKRYALCIIILSLIFCACGGNLPTTAPTATPGITAELTATPAPPADSTPTTVTTAPTATPGITAELTATPASAADSTPATVTPCLEDSQQTDSQYSMTVHFIDVGQGDSILIESLGHYMLIDAGENKYGDDVSKYLSDLGVTTLDYVIGTHPHSDHIGGLDDVIETFDVLAVIMPEVSNNTVTFEDVLLAIQAEGIGITVPVPGDKYSLGSAEFTIVAPNATYGSNMNNYSVGIRIVNGDNSFVMCGDAEKTAEADIVANGQLLSADVIKLGHHGSDTSSSDIFLAAVSPAYAVISCGTGNSYGHPADETLIKLDNAGIKYFRTDLQGTIIVTSDGTNLTWNVEPCQSSLITN